MLKNTVDCYRHTRGEKLVATVFLWYLCKKDILLFVSSHFVKCELYRTGNRIYIYIGLSKYKTNLYILELDV